MKKQSLVTRVFNGFTKKLFDRVLSGVGSSGWFPLIRESFSGAWQKGETVSIDTALTHYAVYACVTRIAGDTAKLRYKLMQKEESGIWKETKSASFSPVLKKPNRFQNHIQFKQWWMVSKLAMGNTYVLKERDNRGVVIALYILDPLRVTPLVASDGGVYYQLGEDDLTNALGAVVVPASEIIHDRMNCLFHPLVGIPPVFSNGLAAANGLAIQKDSKNFFSNSARPSGVLTAPGSISDEVATRLKTGWEANFSGDNSGKIAVLGDDLKFEPMRATAVDSQVIEQLELTAKIVCTTFHVPGFKIGIGAIPAGTKVEDLNQIYYSDCLQQHFEEMELCLDEGLKLPDTYKIELDLDGLLRMDNTALYKMLGEGVKGCLLTPDEARLRINHAPIPGGNTVYMQQQNFSLAALAKRDATDDPFKTSSNQPPAAPVDPELEDDDDEDIENDAKALALFLNKELLINEN